MVLIGIRETTLRKSPHFCVIHLHVCKPPQQPLVLKLQQTGISKIHIFTSTFYYLKFFILYCLITQRGKKGKISGQTSVGWWHISEQRVQPTGLSPAGSWVLEQGTGKPVTKICLPPLNQYLAPICTRSSWDRWDTFMQDKLSTKIARNSRWGESRCFSE